MARYGRYGRYVVTMEDQGVDLARTQVNKTDEIDICVLLYISSQMLDMSTVIINDMTIIISYVIKSIKVPF